MKVKDLIEALRRFDPELHVAAYLERTERSILYDWMLPEQAICHKSDNGFLVFSAPNDPRSVPAVLSNSTRSKSVIKAAALRIIGH